MSRRLSRREFLRLMSLISLASVTSSSRALGTAPAVPDSREKPPNVLILVFDAFSARHASLYGYHRDTTPHMARFAERSTVYHAHHSAGNCTPSGTASILSGTYPWTHRAFHHFAPAKESFVDRNLLSLYRRAAYHTIAYTHNPVVTTFLNQVAKDLDLLKKLEDLLLFYEGVISKHVAPDDFSVAHAAEGTALGRVWRLPMRMGHASPFLSALHGAWRSARTRSLSREYADRYPRGLPGSRSVLLFTLEDAIDWIKRVVVESPQPFFAYFHLLPPHEPYTPRREFVGLFDDAWVAQPKPRHFFSMDIPERQLNKSRREYDEYIAHVDAEFGRLYDHMARSGLLDSTYVVLTSDHGELFERGIWEHSTEVLYQPVVHVPLLISRPGQQEREDVHVPTSGVDLLPTLLHVTGQDVPPWCEGEILPPFAGREGRSDRSIYVLDAKRNPKMAPLSIGTVALIKDRYKLIHYFGYDGYEDEYELYDLADDPEELHDLYPQKPSIASELQNELLEKLREVNEPYL